MEDALNVFIEVSLLADKLGDDLSWVYLVLLHHTRVYFVLLHLVRNQLGQLCDEVPILVLDDRIWNKL